MHKKFEELIIDKKQKQGDWIKTCLASMSAMLALIVAFSNVNSNNFCINIIFSITVSLFGLCILCGLFYLYHDTDTQNRLIMKYLKQTHNLSLPLTTAISVEERKIFLILQKVFFVLIFLSIISLCVYGVLLKFN